MSYYFDENLKYVKEESKSYNIIDATKEMINEIKSAFSWFDYSGESYTREYIDIAQGWGGKINATRQVVTFNFNWTLGTYIPSYAKPITIQIKGDFIEKESQEKIKSFFRSKVDVVLSDMAINTTGIKDIDAIYTGELCKEAMFFSKENLVKEGRFVAKIFLGTSFNEIVALAKTIFKEVKVFKPKSSRKESKESFIICKILRYRL